MKNPLGASVHVLTLTFDASRWFSAIILRLLTAPFSHATRRTRVIDHLHTR